MLGLQTKALLTKLLLLSPAAHGFQCHQSRAFLKSSNVIITRHRLNKKVLLMSTTSNDTNADLDGISKMRAGEMKKELESYGVSTKSFLEKSELVEALVKARSEGLQNKSSNDDNVNAKETTTAATTTTSISREERIAAELEHITQNMKATDMKKELQSLEISTKSFFEKNEFAKALAEARVDGINADVSEQEEEKAVEVEVLPKGDSGPKKRSSDQSQPQQQASNSSPFGGGAGMGGMGGMEDLLKNMGGMGGMGGMADMLKNMGGGGAGAGAGAGGSSPFGGGGMPDMAKVQEMMQNPKIRDIMAKAQGNPKIMSAITECMSNPLAFAKYQNDPEIRDLINEIKPYI